MYAYTLVRLELQTGIVLPQFLDSSTTICCRIVDVEAITADPLPSLLSPSLVVLWAASVCVCLAGCASRAIAGTLSRLPLPLPLSLVPVLALARALALALA